MNKKQLLLLIGIVAIALLALPKLAGSQKPVAGQFAKGGSKSATIVTAIVLNPQVLIEKIVAPGTVLAYDAVELKSEASGRLTSLLFKEGNWVEKGALLAKINDADLQAQLQKLSAILKTAQDNEARQKGLIDKNIISKEVYESALRDFDMAQADVALLKAQIAKTEIRAPFAGVVGISSVSSGAYLSPGMPIATIVSNSQLKIDFSVPEKYAGRVAYGNRVLFTTAGSRSESNATVYALDPMVNEDTRSVHIRALCAKPEKGIFPGSFAEVTLLLGEKSDALMVPTEALVPDATGQKVFCIKDGLAVAKSVSTGVRDSTMVEITLGLSAGDSVIISGVLLVKAGSPVSTALPKSASEGSKKGKKSS